MTRRDPGGFGGAAPDQQPPHVAGAELQPVAVVHAAPGHAGSELHAFWAHVTSHEHEVWQSTASHDACPEHVILHCPDRQRTSLHDSVPLQLTVHDFAPSQSSLSHEPARAQFTVQSHPVGHVTELPPSMAQVRAATSHVVHPTGQPVPLLPEPPTMHSPSLHTRPFEQSVWTEHA